MKTQSLYPTFVLFTLTVVCGSVFFAPVQLYGGEDTDDDGNQTNKPPCYDCEQSANGASSGAGTASNTTGTSSSPGTPANAALRSAATSNPIDLYRGTVAEEAIDLMQPGPVFGWQHRRTYDSRLVDSDGSEASGVNGIRWFSDVAGPYLRLSGSDAHIYIDASSKRVFDWNGSSFDAPDDYNATLVKSGSGSSEEYTLTELNTGSVFIFYGRDGAISSENRGRLKERTSRQYAAEGDSGVEYTYTTGGKVSQVTLPQGWTVNYTYYTSGTEAYRLQKIEVKDGTTVVQKAEYWYPGNTFASTGGHPNIGPDHSLSAVKISRATSDFNNSDFIVRWWLYRYYDVAQADGDEYQLKMVFEPDAVERIVTAGNTAVDDPLEICEKSDTYTVAGGNSIEDYASRSFTYYTSDEDTSAIDTPFTSGTGTENLHSKYGGSQADEFDLNNGYGLVKTETINGPCAGCGGGGGGGIVKHYFYMELNTTTDPDDVEKLVVEDVVDADGTADYRRIYGLNIYGVKLRDILIDDPNSANFTAWCNSITLNSKLRVAERRMPSAHTLVNTNSEAANFLDPTSGTNDDDTQNSSDGLIYVYEHNSDGYRTGTRVKKGRTGTSYYVSANDWGDGTNDKPKWLPTASYTYPTKTGTRSSGKKTSFSYTFWNAGDTQVQKITTTQPSISSGQNGSGTATTTETYLDRLGRLRWMKDGESYVHYTSYHPDTGAVAYQASDIDPSSMPSDATGNDTLWISANDDGDGDSSYASAGKPSRGGSLPSVLDLVANTEFDELGRQELFTDTGDTKHYTIYDADKTMRFPSWDGTNNKPLVPIEVSAIDDGGRLVESYSVDPDRTDPGTGPPTGLSSGTGQSHYITLTKYSYDDLTGRLEFADRYHDIPSSGDGTLSTNFYRMATLYDAMGRTQTTVQVVSGTAVGTSTEQVTKRTFDVLGRTTKVERGVSDDSHNMTADYDTMPTTLETISETEYDSGNVGDGHVTQTKSYYGTGSGDVTGQNLHVTYRGHLRGIEPFYGSGETDIGPWTVYDVDWMGRTTYTGVYDSEPTWTTVLTGDNYSAYVSITSSNREFYSNTSYDDLGRVYLTQRYNPAGTSRLRVHNYYDRNGRLAATGDQYGSATELAYDGAGRQYQTRTVKELNSTKYSSGAFSYQSPTPHPTLSSMTGGDDNVIEFTHQAFDDSGNVTESHTFEMSHNDTDGLDLTGDDDYVRGTVYQWYDDADRLTTIGNYGSGDTTAGAGTWKYVSTIPTRSGTAPTSSSDTKLVTKYAYNADSGRLETVTDPEGTITKTTYDDLGRRIKVEEDDTGSDERHTLWGYNGLDQVRQLIADVGKDDSRSGDGWSTDADDQDTLYLYEDDVDASRVTNEIYPDSSDTTSSGSDQVKFQYNVDGTLSKRTDQRGTVIDYTYNNRRQLELQKVTTLGGADNHVRSIKRSYDDLARIEFITSYENSGGTGTIRNQIKYVYDSNNLLWIAYQSHEGAVGSTPAVVYAYDTSTTSSVYNDGLRLTTVTPPSGNALTLDYGSSNGVDDRLMRVQNLKVTLPGAMSATNVVTYSYNGTGRLAEVDYGEADVRLDYWGSSETNDNYEYYDRFGRIRTQRWYDYGASSVADQFDYTHDYAGNRLTRDIPSALYGTNNKDHAYTYDDLHRLKTYDKGTLSGSTISGTPANEEDWTLDALGNWTDFIQKASGTTTLNQDRTHNDVNEITAITATTGTNWADPVHDAAGNMTEIPKPDDLANSYDLTYDAWNRLVKVEDGMTVVAEYEYDGLNRRIIKDDQTTAFHYYYNESWQCVEVREDSDTDPSKQYYWHTYYIDALALRYHDDNGDGDFQDTDEIQYGSHDANFNVTALYESDGDVRERYEYTPYGEATVIDADFSSDADGASDVDNAYLYTGRRFDEETGQQLNRRRFYASSLGKWLQRDPLSYLDSMNLYEYVVSSPLNSLDPMGMSKGGPQNIRPSDIPADWTVEQVEEYLKRKIREGASQAHIRAIRAWLKVLKRGGAVLGPIGIVLTSPNTAGAPEFRGHNGKQEWRSDQHGPPESMKCECVCTIELYKWIDPPWFAAYDGQWSMDGDHIETRSHGKMSAKDCAALEYRIISRGKKLIRRTCTWGGEARYSPSADKCTPPCD